MFDRTAFWSPAPDWRHARLEGRGLSIAAVTPPALWRLSGTAVPSLLASLGVSRTIGPREACDDLPYALRLSPDSVLLACSAAAAARLQRGFTAPGLAQTELTDGIVCIDLAGPGAADLMALAGEQALGTAAARPQESARVLFAGLTVAVMLRSDGWRLHVERPWAPALWRWLAEHVAITS
ncbi:MAG: hypothetical protein O9284_15765 [Steroidobacteraceae bacterium]|jgi:sarcosine oxidase gamma subunit|nr:hypothetical protein [Steroidobacteraceae bacterium]